MVNREQADAGCYGTGQPKAAATGAIEPRSGPSGDATGAAPEGGQGAPNGPTGTENSGTCERARLKSRAAARLFAVASRTVSAASPHRHSIMRSTEVWSNWRC